MKRTAFCHFCDDIRMEVGGKISIMGIYGSELYVAAMPAVLPKLTMLALVTTPVDQPIQALTIRVYRNGEVVSETDVPKEYLAGKKREQDESDPIEGETVGTNVTISPFVIEREEVLKVTAVVDGVEIKAGRIRIGKQDAPPQ